MLEGLPIITERLILNRFHESDAPFLIQLMNEPAYHANVGDRNINTEAKAREYMREKFFPSYKENGFGYYIIRLRHMDFPIGSCGLFKRPFLDDIDIGYALLEDYTGMGYAFEAANAVKNYVAETLDLKNLIAITSRENTKSQKLLKKLGFYKEKITLWDTGEEVVQFRLDNFQ